MTEMSAAGGGNAEEPIATPGQGADAPADPAAQQPEAVKRRSRDPKVFVLLRELSEVHLLLDNLSANPTTTVSELASDERLAAHKLKPDWIEEVCKISWPPDGSNEEKSEDAALLIRAKDFLNRLSHPASGSTIAFTLLVTQEDAAETKRWWQWRRREQSGAAAAADGAVPAPDDAKPAKPPEPTRSSLARTAYPDLVGKALGFRRGMQSISIGLVVALVLTCALSWYVAYGNAALAELATARATLAEAQTRVNGAETAEWTQAGDAPRQGDDLRQDDGPREGDGLRQDDGPREGEGLRQGDGAAIAAGPIQPTPATAAPPRIFTPYCGSTPYANPTEAQLCNARDSAQRNRDAIEQRLAIWLCWDMIRDCTNDPKARDAPSRAAAFANILGSAVLPFLYGLLGAGASIIRSLSRKIRESRLSPRDLVLSFQQLALGAVVGACIGLFVVAPGADATGESLLGPVALSASAISFVAGFGVEAVFQALEALITRIFNITATAPADNRGEGLPRG